MIRIYKFDEVSKDEIFARSEEIASVEGIAKLQQAIDTLQNREASLQTQQVILTGL